MVASIASQPRNTVSRPHQNAQPVTYSTEGQRLAEEIFTAGAEPAQHYRQIQASFEQMLESDKTTPAEKILANAGLQSPQFLSQQIALAVKTGLSGSLGFVMGHCFEEATRPRLVDGFKVQIMTNAETSEALGLVLETLKAQDSFPIERELATAAAELGYGDSAPMEQGRVAALGYIKDYRPDSGRSLVQSIAEMALKGTEAAGAVAASIPGDQERNRSIFARTGLEAIHRSSLAEPTEKALASLGIVYDLDYMQPRILPTKAEEMLRVLSADLTKSPVATVTEFSLNPGPKADISEKWTLLKNGFQAILDLPGATDEQRNLAEQARGFKPSLMDRIYQPEHLAAITSTMEKIKSITS